MPVKRFSGRTKTDAEYHAFRDQVRNFIDKVKSPRKREATYTVDGVVYQEVEVIYCGPDVDHESRG